MTIYDRLDDAGRIRYPFVEDTTLRYAAGSTTITLPDSIFLDAAVSAYAGASAVCALNSVRLSNGTLYALFDICGEAVEISVPLAGVIGAVPFMLSNQLSGSFLFDNDGLPGLAALMVPDAVYTRVDTATGILERSCVIYSLGGAVLSLTGDLVSGASTITGDIEVLDGVNTRVRVDAARNEVVIFAEPGIGLPNCLQRIVAVGDDVLRYFNGAAADATGNVTLATDGRLRLLPSADGTELQLSVAPDIAALVDCTPLYDIPENPVE